MQRKSIVCNIVLFFILICATMQVNCQYFINRLNKSKNYEDLREDSEIHDEAQIKSKSSENIREEDIENEVPLKRKKFRLWKPLRAGGNIHQSDVENKTNIISNKEHTSTFRKEKNTNGKKSKTKSLVKSKLTSLHEPFRTQDKGILDRCYMRAKLKLDYEKVSPDDFLDKPSLNEGMIEKKLNLSSLFSKEKCSSAKPVISIPKNFAGTNKMSNCTDSLEQKEKLSYGNLLCMMIILSTIPLVLCAFFKSWRHKKYMDEIEFLFRRKSPFDPDSDSSKDLCRHLEDSSHESYGSISDEEVKSERTLLNLTRDKVDLSNITLCKKCHLYQFKSVGCCK